MVKAVGIVLLVVLGLAAAAKLPDNYKKCKRNQPKYNECMTEAVEDALTKLKSGAPELGVFPLDPLVVISLHIGKGNSPVNIGLKFDNVKLYGISNSKLTNHKIDFKKLFFEVDALTPYLRLEGDYEMDGKVLLLPIRGKGKCNITIDNLKSHIHHTGYLFEKGGNSYLNDTQFVFKMDLPEKMQLNFENLFNGDPTLGPSTNSFLNENWPEIFNELKPSLEEALGAIFLDISNRFFLKVPFKEIFPEK